uniref:EF-hand domain pair-containing protein n=1 Tax=Spironucleus salmonicida TaxID=348837 RepID=V6M7P2_9EUKA|eukprot:EST49494.1 EF-hand domain pair-containing protein [Spironucleus salmonicida]
MNQDQLRRVFVQMDGSNKGKISAKDMSDTLRHIGIDVNPLEASSIIELVDRDEDKMLTFKEFLHFMYIIENVRKMTLLAQHFLQETLTTLKILTNMNLLLQ